jgi:2-phosphosulfolactate phosphatase
MRVDVLFDPGGLNAGELQARAVFVVDILRATTTLCTALDHGARSAIPVGSTEEALRLAQTIGSTDVLLAGEKNCVRIPGFQLGNSPLEMTETAVRGKTLIITTSNGSRALLACQGAQAVYLVAAVNLSLAAERVREAAESGHGVLIVCAGRHGAFSLDDAYCAGRLLRAAFGGRKQRRRLNDGGIACLDLVRRYGDAWERPLSSSRSGRELIKLGFRDDLHAASRLDAHPVLPHFHERRVTLVPVPV